MIVISVVVCHLSDVSIHITATAKPVAVEIAPDANPRVRGIHGQPAQFKQGTRYESKSSMREGEHIIRGEGEEEDEDENAEIWEPAPSEMSITLECR